MRRSGVRLWARSRRFTTLPVIDVRALVTSDSTLAERKAVGALLHAACRDVGFFNIVGHGVPKRVSSGVLSASRAWFERTSESDKRAIALSPATGFRGYAAMGMNVTQGACLHLPLQRGVPHMLTLHVRRPP
jgi:isopenicillin N synthase-like dioxygenase